MHIPSMESHNQIILIVTQTELACLRGHNSGNFWTLLFLLKSTYPPHLLFGPLPLINIDSDGSILVFLVVTPISMQKHTPEKKTTCQKNNPTNAMNFY
jgi:hypothetical protein